MLAIVVHERKEQRVRLAFRCGAPFDLWVYHASLRINKARTVRVPELPRALLATGSARDSENRDDYKRYPYAHSRLAASHLQCSFSSAPIAPESGAASSYS